MTIIIPVILIICVVVGALLLRNVSGQRKVVIALLAAVWTGVVFVLGFTIGEIKPTYRGNIAIQTILRETNKALEDGQCDRAKMAFSDAQRFLDNGGSFHDAARQVGEKLRSQPEPHATPAISDQ